MNLKEAAAAFKEGKPVTITHKSGKSKTFQIDKIAAMFRVPLPEVSFSNCLRYGCAGWHKNDLTFSVD